MQVSVKRRYVTLISHALASAASSPGAGAAPSQSQSLVDLPRPRRRRPGMAAVLVAEQLGIIVMHSSFLLGKIGSPVSDPNVERAVVSGEAAFETVA